MVHMEVTDERPTDKRAMTSVEPDGRLELLGQVAAWYYEEKLDQS